MSNTKKHNRVDDIFSAIRHNDMQIYLSLIDATNVNSCDSNYKRSMLHEAIANHADSIAYNLIERGICLNQQDKNGQTALHFCAQYNCYEVAKTILAKDAEINLVDEWGNNPLWVAVFNARGKYRMVRLFVDYHVDIHNKNKANRSPLDFATQIGDDTMVKILLQEGGTQ